MTELAESPQPQRADRISPKRWLWAWVKRWWPQGLLVLMAVLFFADSLFAGKALQLRDTLCDFLSYRAMQKQAIFTGHIPLWNPLSGCGQPFLGDPLCGAFYPLLVLFHFLPLVTGLKLTLLLHTIIAATGIYSLTRWWGCEKLPALIAAVAFAFSTYFIVWMEYVLALAGFAWIPWLWFATGRLAEALSDRAGLKGRRWLLNPWTIRQHIAIVTVVLVLLYLTDSPETFAFNGLLLASYVTVYFSARFGWQTMLRTVQAMAIALVLMGLIVSPEALLLAKHIPFSVRSSNFDPLMSQASLHPIHWLTLVLPFLFGKEGYPDKYFVRTIYEFWAGACYIGILPLLLALSAAVLGWQRDAQRPGKRVLIAFFLASAVFGVLASSGLYSPVFPFLNKYVIGFTRMRWPGKCLFFFVLPMIFLAGLGGQAILERASEFRNSQARLQIWTWLTPMALALLGITLLLTLFCRAGDGSDLFRALTFGQADPNPPRIAALLGQIQFAGWISIGAAVALAMLNFRRIPIWIAMAMALAITYVDVALVGRQVHPIGPDSLYRYDPSTVRSIMGGDINDLYRIHSNYSVIQQQLYGLDDPGAFQFARNLGAGNSLIALGAHSDWTGGMVQARYVTVYGIYSSPNENIANRLADLMSVTHLIAPSPVPGVWHGEPLGAARAFARQTALPRALLLPYWMPRDSLEQSLQLIFDPSFDPRFAAAIEPDEEGHVAPAAEGDVGPIHGDVTDIKYDYDSVTLKCQTDHRALLLLNDSWYPGWKARVDGVSTPIYRANALFRGIIVKPGKHQVSFDYEPWQFRAGMAMSVTTIAGMSLVLLVPWWRNKKGRKRKSLAAPSQSSESIAAPVAIPLPRTPRR